VVENGRTQRRPVWLWSPRLLRSVRARAVRVGHRFLLLRDHRALGRQLGVERLVVGPFAREVVFVEDGLDGAFRDAGFAVNALVGMNVQHRLPLVETFYGAHHNAVGVFAIEARLSNDVGHSGPFPRNGRLRYTGSAPQKMRDLSSGPARCQASGKAGNPQDFREFLAGVSWTKIGAVRVIS